MSFSIDDLVSSLSSSHIGQEAIDLATLQAQLTKTLSASTPSDRQVPRGYTQPCTTPTGRTPSSSFSMSSWEAPTRQPVSAAYFNSAASNNVCDDFEDELMVEELLLPQSTCSSHSNANSSSSMNHSPFSSTSSSSYHPSLSNSHHHHRSPTSSTFPSDSLPSPSQSLFTSTDPFYLQAQANSQAQSYFYGTNTNTNTASPTQSLFTQNGRPAQSSPFVSQQAAAGYHLLNHQVAPPAQFHGYHMNHHNNGHLGMAASTMAAF